MVMQMKDGRRAKAKRTRIDNASGAAAAHEAVLAGPPPLPEHLNLRECDRPFWDAIMRARARDEWGRIELALAAQLAGIQADIERCRGFIATPDKAAMKRNGYGNLTAVRMDMGALLQHQIRLMRALRITGTVVGDPIDEMPRRKAERQAEQTIKRLRAASSTEMPNEPPLLAL